MINDEELIKKYELWLKDIKQEKENLVKRLNYLEGEEIKYQVFIKELKEEVV